MELFKNHTETALLTLWLTLLTTIPSALGQTGAPAHFGTNAALNDLQFRYRIVAQDATRRISFLSDSIPAVNSNASLNPEERADCLMFIGQRYYSDEQTDKALELFYGIVKMTVSDFRKADALRMIAQTEQYRKHNLRAATNAYAQLNDIIKKSAEHRMLQWRNQFSVDVITKGSQALESLQLSAQASALRETALTNNNLKLSPDTAAFLLVENARSHRKIGNSDKCIALFDELFVKFPNYGKNDGSIVGYRLERANAHGYDKISESHLQLLQQIWNELEFRGHAQVFIVGKQLGLGYRASSRIDGNTRYETHLRSIISVAQSNVSSFNPRTRNIFGVDTTYEFALIELGNLLLYGGKPGPAAEQYRQAKELFPDSQNADFVQSQLYSAVEQEKRIDRASHAVWIRFGITMLSAAGLVVVAVTWFKRLQTRGASITPSK